MNYAPREFSHEPPDCEHTKTVLFCQTCGRAAGIDEWPEQVRDGRAVRLDCPDCGEVVWRGLDDDESSEKRRAPTPTP
ncbi:hypothetical protein C457_14119 [Haloferax prahovense DSM 18310]|uniref:DUF8106 domain-containing protein n=1 Tax=Haloferax prahovense (strain DSM 18310 / JCM 13924 / TL6) TaxID=1227461 RepID=M0G6M4_HALPT|nr:hypothetical protein [Haloferax prahovense]ELZ67177.1 hypothetical protein C457_14119 [Haloferax prahovense DSM 18310]